ncbi:MAG: metallophosphoesterase family protein [Polyangiaceae bacterium]
MIEGDLDLSHVRRLGVLGDLHCEDATLERVLAFLRSAGTEANVSVGDLMDGHGDPNRALSLLEDAQVLAVRGNHDRWLLTNRHRELPLATSCAALSARSLSYLGSLPVTRSLSTARGRVLLCHGIANNDLAGVRPDESEAFVLERAEIATLLNEGKFDFVISGHTHHAMLRRIGKLLLLNAGTLHSDYRRAFALFDLGAARYQVFAVFPDAIELAADWSLHEQLAFWPP